MLATVRYRLKQNASWVINLPFFQTCDCIVLRKEWFQLQIQKLIEVFVFSWYFRVRWILFGIVEEEEPGCIAFVDL